MSIHEKELVDEPTNGIYVKDVRRKIGDVQSLQEKLGKLENLLTPYSANEPIEDKSKETGQAFETDMDSALNDLDEEITNVFSHIDRLISEFRG